jgi:hypothetical protein
MLKMENSNFKYLYFNSENNTKYYLNNLDELKDFYYKSCNPKYLFNFKKDVDNDFYKNMLDGYLIIDVMEKYYHFFIELEHFDKIYDEVFDDVIIGHLKSIK